jgi:hypothetical protein
VLTKLNSNELLFLFCVCNYRVSVSSWDSRSLVILTQRGVVKKWSFWFSKMGPIGCPETSVRNYHSTLSNIPEERRSHLHRCGSLKSRTVRFILSLSTAVVTRYITADAGFLCDEAAVLGDTIKRTLFMMCSASLFCRIFVRNVFWVYWFLKLSCYYFLFWRPHVLKLWKRSNTVPAEKNRYWRIIQVISVTHINWIKTRTNVDATCSTHGVNVKGSLLNLLRKTSLDYCLQNCDKNYPKRRDWPNALGL